MSEIVASRIDWLFAPEWVTFGVACFLSGWDADSMREIVREGGVDVNTEGLIEKRSLHEFNECAALIAHWDD